MSNASDEDELVLLVVGGKDGYVERDGRLVDPERDLQRRQSFGGERRPERPGPRALPLLPTEWMPPLLRQTAERSPPRLLADLGAGDGGTLWPLDQAGLVGETIYAVDISAEHVAALPSGSHRRCTGSSSDVAHVDELADASVDAVVSSQVIEHLPDDRVLAPEIARILKPGGWFYVSSVIRGPHAFWMYKGKPPAPERWQLDPTHMREYESEKQFRACSSIRGCSSTSCARRS